MAGDLYLENLEEFVFDENRIVTYKWLSQTLEVHVNKAKQMLYKFVDQQKQKDDGSSINHTYLVSGLQKNTNGDTIHKIAIVNGNNLEKFKAGLQRVSGVHIYSVQRSQLKDSNALYTTDYDTTQQQIKNLACNRFSAIHCPEAKIRSTAEISKLEEKSILPIADSRAKTSSNVNGLQKCSATTSNGSNTISTLTEQNTHKLKSTKTVSKNVPPKQGQRSAVDMFASAKAKIELGTKTAGTAESTVPVSKVGSKTKAKSKPGIGMLAFLSKVADKPKEEQKERKNEVAINCEKVKKEDQTVDRVLQTGKDDLSADTVLQTGKDDLSTESRQPATKQSKIKRKLKRVETPDSDEEKNPKKKQRRRIMMAVSSSEEDEDDESDDEPIPPSPLQQTTKLVEDKEVDNIATSEQSTTGGSEVECRKKRTKVMKSRQVLDQDGYMVTEKYSEIEYTEVSDDNEPLQKKASSPQKPESNPVEDDIKKVKGKKSLATNMTKQKTLTSFFKKI